MDTLDDFTILDIIMLCDMRTVFGALPLVCRRMHALHDDVTVARRFRDELRAQLEKHIDSGAAVLPLDLVVKAGLDDFTLTVEICIGGAAKTRVKHLWARYQSITPVKELRAILELYQCVKYVMSCKLSTTFERIYQQIDDVLADTLNASVAYVVYSSCASGTIHRHDGDRVIYDLGIGCKYTTLMAIVRD